MTRVKICGITRFEDAMLAVELGADALGFIFEPSSPRYLREVPEWVRSVPPYVAKVAVYGKLPLEFPPLGFHTVQGLGWTEAHRNSDYARVGVVRLGSSQYEDEMRAALQHCHAAVLDTFSPSAFGGTGQKVDWELAGEIVREVPKPVILAGGLTPDNVADAVAAVRPYAVDVSSGIESEPGLKDPVMLRDFIAAARQ